MFSRLRRRFTYANVAMTLALVFAMSGGAYAAGKYLITSTKQIKPSVLKQLQGKTGPAGQAGTNGTNGGNGAPGEKGAEGKQGAPGKNGENGKDGTTGFTKTLPSGESEKGDWSAVYEATAANQPMSSAISFTIPLKAAPEAHYIGTNEELAGEPNEAAAIKEKKCMGSYEKPGAAPGNLCLFTETSYHATEFNFFGPDRFSAVGPYGAVFVTASTALGVGEPSEVVAVYGTWAVTAE